MTRRIIMNAASSVKAPFGWARTDVSRCSRVVKKVELGRRRVGQRCRWAR